MITTTETAYAATLDVGEHTWRVRAYNQLGYSGYTPEWSVSVVDAPGTPELLIPADGRVTSSQAITLTWQAGTGGTPDGYLLELDGEVITTTETTYTTTPSAGLHTWRASAFNLAGNSPFSEAWDFTISAAPGIPTPVSPEDGAYLASSLVTLSWEAGSGPAPDGYHLLLDGEVMTVTGTTTMVMLAGGEHTWQVRAFIGDAVSEYSPEQSFTVGEEPASIKRMAFPLPDKPSIAVLPFDNLSANPQYDSLADGVSENIIYTLSYLPDMFLIARNSTFTYKGKPVKIQQLLKLSVSAMYSKAAS